MKKTTKTKVNNLVDRLADQHSKTLDAGGSVKPDDLEALASLINSLQDTDLGGCGVIGFMAPSEPEDDDE